MAKNGDHANPTSPYLIEIFCIGLLEKIAKKNDRKIAFRSSIWESNHMPKLATKKFYVEHAIDFKNIKR